MATKKRKTKKSKSKTSRVKASRKAFTTKIFFEKGALLHPMSFALAGGILWAAGILVITILANYHGYGSMHLTQILQEAYPGYALTNEGVLKGMVWAFIDGFVGLGLLSLLYNYINKNYS